MNTLDQTQVGAYHVAQLRTQARRDADARALHRGDHGVRDRLRRSLRSR